MKRRFFGRFFYCFSRPQIYKAIAAIFWQSASYDLKLLPNEVCSNYISALGLFFCNFSLDRSFV